MDNNGVILLAQARQANHYIAEADSGLLDAPACFANEFCPLSAYCDPASWHQADRMRWRAIGAGRDTAQATLGERRTLELIFAVPPGRLARRPRRFGL